jgi:hypothetical protein
VNIESNTFSFLADQENKTNNQIDFNLFDVDYNRIVVLTKREKEYYLQLLSLNGSELIHEILI